MSVLSNQDIIRQLGKGIFFHPLKVGSIKACELCLTASEYAYAIGEKNRLKIESEQKANEPGEEQKFFYIPPRDTTLVWTDESIYLGNNFRGPLYSVVAEVSQGIGHIGTRVNPGWSGVLCIALHNVSDEKIRINVRDVNQPIVYLAIEKLSSKASSSKNPERNARLDVLRGKPNTQEIFDYFNQREHGWMKGDKDSLKQLMLSSKEYQQLKGGLYNKLLGLLGSDAQTRWTAGSVIVGFLSLIVAIIALVKPSEPPNSTNNFIPQTQLEMNKTVNPNPNN